MRLPPHPIIRLRYGFAMKEMTEVYRCSYHTYQEVQTIVDHVGFTMDANVELGVRGSFFIIYDLISVPEVNNPN